MQSGFRLFPMMWTVKNDFDADPFYPDRNAVRWVVSISNPDRKRFKYSSVDTTNIMQVIASSIGTS